MIYPVILCGGSGTRLWPLSRKSYPKQFTKLLGDKTLFQSTIDRFSETMFEKPLVITAEDFRFMVTEQLTGVGVNATAVIIEPEARNTAPAILAAAIWLQKFDPDALMLVSPADHLIKEYDLFHESVLAGVSAAKDGQLITFGVQPTYPETGYGYLKVLKKVSKTTVGAFALKQFVEKPDAKTAEDMFKSEAFLWNSGIYLFSVGAIIEAFKDYAPDLIPPVNKAVDLAEPDLGFLRLEKETWATIRDISIDYAVMEKAKNLSVVPFGGSWSDAGGWEAVWRESKVLETGLSKSNNVTTIDCQDSLLRSEDTNMEIVGIGLKDIIVVATQDAVLVADMSRSQDVKNAVNVLKVKSVKQAETFPKDHRPWGWFESLAIGDRFQVKRIVVHSGATLSLQSHNHRSEHWIVVAGTAEVTIGDDVKLISENQSVYIPLGVVHRLHNPGKIPLTLVEVQTGSYLGEDDITRYEDIYARR